MIFIYFERNRRKLKEYNEKKSHQRDFRASEKKNYPEEKKEDVEKKPETEKKTINIEKPDFKPSGILAKFTNSVK